MSKLVLWGHPLSEYLEMFDLNQQELTGKILEFGCGPSAVNAQLEGIAAERVSCDPLFNLDIDTLKTKVALVFADMAKRVRAAQDKFDFELYGDLDGLLQKRQEGIDQFFADYKAGLQEKRYIGVNNIHLPYPDCYFDFALSSHYLFADLEDQDINFHVEMIKELARVAKEVRIFPLIDRYGNPSPFLGPVLLALQQGHYGTELRSVPYHLQTNGNAMLRVWAQACEL